jgi:hypothetical protein
MNDHIANDNESNGSDGTSGDVAVIGESSKSTQVSLQTLQGIYNELTGKSEEVGKSYSKPTQVKFSDIEQLNHKITQACEQYNVVAGNCSITVYYVDDTRDRFTSFDRFRLHNSGSTSPVESVLLKYHFLVLLPKTKQPQTYTVSIRLASRVAVAKRMESEFYGTPPSIFRLMGNRTAVIEIQYVDYMVARNFLNLIDEWFKGIPTATESKSLYWLQARSHLIPRVARFATAVFVALLVVALLPTFIAQGATDLLSFGRFLGYALLGIYAAYTLSGWSATFIVTSLDHYTALSYLQLTKGDELEISKAERSNTFAIAKGIGGLVLTICVSVATKIVVNILTP